MWWGWSEIIEIGSDGVPDTERVSDAEQVVPFSGVPLTG
jgi:hypothetical protein